MRARWLALVLVVACKKPAPPPAPVADAGAAPAVASSELPINTVVDASAPVVLTDKLEIVAVGKPSSHVIWLKAMGDRVWLSAQNLDAFSDGDGPLVKGKDPFATLKYQAGKEILRTTGTAKHLFTLKFEKIETRTEDPHPEAFVFQPDGSWTRAAGFKEGDVPFSLMPYHDGALFVFSQLAGTVQPDFHKGEKGTRILALNADGTAAPAPFEPHPMFVAIEGASDGDNVALLGTFGVKPPKDYVPPYPEAPWETSTVAVVRYLKDQPAKTVTVRPGPWDGNDLPMQWHVRQQGTKTLAYCESFPTTIVVIGVDGKISPRNLPERGLLYGAELVGDDVYAIGQVPGGANGLYHFDSSGNSKVEKLGAKCTPVALAVRGTNDLWVSAECPSPTIFRYGRPQTPIQMP